MSPIYYMILPYRRFTDFRGRSCRAEYWWCVLFVSVIGFSLTMLMWASGVNIPAIVRNPEAYDYWQVVTATSATRFASGLFLFFQLFSALPMLALTVRRLHDLDRSGLWFLGYVILSDIPYAGRMLDALVLIAMCVEGTGGPNRFGPDPKGSLREDLSN